MNINRDATRAIIFAAMVLLMAPSIVDAVEMHKGDQYPGYDVVVKDFGCAEKCFVTLTVGEKDIFIEDGARDFPMGHIYITISKTTDYSTDVVVSDTPTALTQCKDVSINSDPSGIDVSEFGGDRIGITPFNLRVCQEDQKRLLVFENSEYRTQTKTVDFDTSEVSITLEKKPVPTPIPTVITPEPTPEPTPEVTPEPIITPKKNSLVVELELQPGRNDWIAPIESARTNISNLTGNASNLSGIVIWNYNWSSGKWMMYDLAMDNPEWEWDNKLHYIEPGGSYVLHNQLGVSKNVTWELEPVPAPVPTPEPTPVPTPEPTPVPTPEPTPVNIVGNGDFELGTSWRFYTNGMGTFSAKTTGNSSKNIQLYQTRIILEPNTRYKLSFSAYSSSGHDMNVRLIKHVAPYTAYMPDFFVNLGTSWQTFTTEFITTGFTGTVNDGRLMFWLASYAAAGDEYHIDDVRLEKIEESEPILSIPNSRMYFLNETLTLIMKENACNLSGNDSDPENWKISSCLNPVLENKDIKLKRNVTSDSWEAAIVQYESIKDKYILHNGTEIEVYTFNKTILYDGKPMYSLTRLSYPQYNYSLSYEYSVKDENSVNLSAVLIKGNIPDNVVNQSVYYVDLEYLEFIAFSAPVVQGTLKVGYRYVGKKEARELAKKAYESPAEFKNTIDKATSELRQKELAEGVKLEVKNLGDLTKEELIRLRKVLFE